MAFAGHGGREFPNGGVVFARVAGMSVLAVPLSHWIFLTCRLYARQDPDAQEYDRAHHDPVPGHVRQVRAISQPADHDHETHCIKAQTT